MNVLPWTSPGPTSRADRDTSLATFDAGVRGAWSWEQPARLRARWQLQVDGAVVVVLSGHAALGMRADVRTAERRWELRPHFPKDVQVFEPGSAESCARYRADWLGGGRIERDGAPTLLWRRESFWRSHWGVQTSEQLPLVHLQSHPALLRRRATLELEDAARRLPDLPLLLALGWYVAMRSRTAHGSD